MRMKAEEPWWADEWAIPVSAFDIFTAQANLKVFHWDGDDDCDDDYVCDYDDEYDQYDNDGAFDIFTAATSKVFHYDDS